MSSDSGLYFALGDRLIEPVEQSFITEQLMNPLPVSLDFTSNSTNKPSSKVTANEDADKFKKELSKQESNTQDSNLANKDRAGNEVKSQDADASSKAATIATDNTKGGEELPPQAEGDQQAESATGIESLQESTELAGLTTQIDQTALSEVQNLNLMPGELGPLSDTYDTLESTLLEGEEGLGSLHLFGDESLAQSGYSASGLLPGSLNGVSANGSGLADGQDTRLNQPLEKLMTLEQMKLSLEKGVETLAELEVDVDTDSEGSIREVFRFNDVQLKQSQSSLKTYTTSVELPVAPGAWADKVNDKIVWLANQKIQFAEIHLNPQDLGPMEVKINVQNDQATVTFNSQHQSVRELLELNVNRLREMMSENGVDLAHVDVSDQSSQQQTDDEDGGVNAQAGEGEDELSSLADEHSITEAITLDNLVDYYA